MLPDAWHGAAARLALAVAVPPQHPDSTVRDTIAAVFRRPEYARSFRTSLWSRFVRWIVGLLDRLFSGSGDHPIGRQVVSVLLLALAALVIARLLWSAAQTVERRRGTTRLRASHGSAGDPWAAARAEAAAGNYVEAAHALYQALLTGLAERERVRLHPSKTAGDYVRDLRALRSRYTQPFREFARAYEVVAYGTGECDRARYERLLALASATLQRATVTAGAA